MFKKGRERRQTRREDRKENRQDRRENRQDRRENNHGKPTTGAVVGAVAIGTAGVVAAGAGAAAYKKNKNNKAKKEEADKLNGTDKTYDSASSSESDFEDGFEIKHLSEYTVLEVQFFMIAIGLENKCNIVERKKISGEVLISFSVQELKVELGCTSFEVKKIQASIEFSFEVTEGSKEPDKPTCKPPQSWTEAEVCLVLVAIGMGQKVEKFQRKHVTGAVMVSATSVELQRECGMTSVEVKKFQAVVVKTEKGGCGIEPDVDTMPSPPPLKEESNSGPNKVAIGVAAGGVGYAKWKNNNGRKEEVVPLPAPEESEPESGEKPPVKHPSSWTKVEVRYFLIAVGMEDKCDKFEQEEVNGKALLKITKQELKVEYGCSSLEIKKFTAAIEFSIEVSDNAESGNGCNKPPAQWTEVEICLVLVMTGMGTKVKKFKRNHVSGAMIMSMSKVELTALQEECGMSSVEVKKFKGVAVKCGHKTSSSGGHGGSSPYKKTTTVAAVSATVVTASSGGGCDEEVEKPPMKEPCDWTKMEVQYFLIAIGFDKKTCDEFKSAGVTGEVLVSMTKSELERKFGCSSSEIKTFTAALAFSIEVTKTECACKPAKKWTEIEVCMVMISIGLGTKVQKIHKHHISGAVVISMSKVELQRKCDMTDFQVTKFKAIVGVSVTVERGRSRSRSPCDSRSSSSSSSSSSCSSKSSKGSKGSKGSKKKKKHHKHHSHKHHSHKHHSKSPDHHCKKHHSKSPDHHGKKHHKHHSKSPDHHGKKHH